MECSFFSVLTFLMGDGFGFFLAFCLVVLRGSLF